MDDDAELEDSIRETIRRGWVQPPGEAFARSVMGALPAAPNVRQRGRLTLVWAAAFSAVATIALVRTILVGSTPIPGATSMASVFDDSPEPTPAAFATPLPTAPVVEFAELLVTQPLGWLAAADGTWDPNRLGAKLTPIGSLGTVPVHQTCDRFSECQTVWEESAEIQVRIEHVARARGWGQWGMVSREAPPGAARITIDGVGAQVRVVDGERVPDTDEVVPGATRIIVWDLPTPSYLWMSYRITAVIRAEDQRADELQSQATQMVEAIEYSPPFRWTVFEDDPVGALKAGLRSLRDLVSRADYLDASCFPDEPGTSGKVVIDKVAFLPYVLTQPLEVTCTSAIEPTEFRKWKMTVRYDWEATDAHPAGHAEMVVLLAKTHGEIGYYGDFFGLDEMPYLRRLPPAP